MSWILNEEAPLRVQLIQFSWRCSILLDGTADEITVNISRFMFRNACFLMTMMRMQTVLQRRYLCPQQQINESEREGPWPQRTILNLIIILPTVIFRFVFPPPMLLSFLNRLMM